jgi:hypothetical protein
MSYFSVLPNLRLPRANNEVLEIKNLYRGIRFRQDLRRFFEFYEPYDLLDGEKPLDVAFKFYGDPTLDWIVLLFNEIVDINNEWPISERDLNNYIRYTYPNPDAIAYRTTKEILDPKTGHLLLESGQEVNQDFFFDLPPTFTGYPFLVSTTAGSTEALLEDQVAGNLVVENVSVGQAIESTGGTFPINTLLSRVERSADGVYSVVLDQAATSTSSNVRIVAKSFQRVRLTGNNVFDTISFDDYERRLNESKRRINILDSRLVTQLKLEFADKIDYKEVTNLSPEVKGFQIAKSLSRFF